MEEQAKSSRPEWLVMTAGTHEVRMALPDNLDGALFGEGEYTLEVLRGKTSRVKLREHDAEALECHRQAEEDRAAEETLV